MSEQRFQPVKGLKANIDNTSKVAGQLLIATDTGEMLLDVSNQERISIGGSGVSIIYAEDPAPQKETDVQYTLLLSTVLNDAKVKVDDLVINLSDGGFYQIQSISSTALYCRRLAISGSGSEDTSTVPKVGFQNDIKSQLKGLYVYGEEFNLKVIPYAEEDTSVILTISVYNEGELTASATAAPYYEYKTTITNYQEEVIELGSHFQAVTNRIHIKLESLNSGSYTWRYGNQQVIDLKLNADEDFQPTTICTSSIDFSCIPMGLHIEKELHILLDGLENEAASVQIGSGSGNKQIVTIIGSSMLQTHGSHTLEAYLTAEVNGQVIESNHLKYNIAYAKPGNTSPIIWFIERPTEIEEYEDIVVKYMVYDPSIGSTGTMSIDQLHNSLVVTTLDEVKYSSSTPFVWNIADYVVGNNYYAISYKGITESFVINVTPSSRNMKYEDTSSLMINLNAAGRTNNESLLSRSKWSYNWNDTSYNCQLNNFNWHTNGWATDDNGKPYLKVSDGAMVKIPLSPITMDSRDSLDSYTFEFRLKIRNITSYDTLIKNVTKYKLVGQEKYVSWEELKQLTEETNATSDKKIEPDDLVETDSFGSQLIKVEKEVSTDKGICVSYLSDSNKSIGLALGTQETYFGTGKEYVNAKYKEDEIFNISYVISTKATQSLSRVYIYVNGLLTGITAISTSTGRPGFTINTPNIVVNSQYCDVDLYAVRVYKTALNSYKIVQNYLADLKNIEDYDQNQISDNVQNLTVISYNKLIDYNQKQIEAGNGDKLSMPYLILQTVDNVGISTPYSTDDGTPVSDSNAEKIQTVEVSDNNLPFKKGSKRYVKATFINPALDYAYDNGDLTMLAKSANCKEEEYYAYHCPSFVAYGGELDVQGTSSQAYPRRNYKLKLKNADYWRYTGGPKTSNDITGKNGLVWCMDVNSPKVHNNKFTLKIDYMESSGSYNTGFANMVHYMYSKHPLDYYRDNASSDGKDQYIEKNILQTYRTSVKGYPVLTFHAVPDASGQLQYNYIGRYNMNIDKGSDESYGFKYQVINGQKADGSDNVVKKFSKTVECWEMADNQGNYCSFKLPSGVNSFAECAKNSKGILEIADHLEYRYHDDADTLDICYNGIDDPDSRKDFNSVYYDLDEKKLKKQLEAATTDTEKAEIQNKLNKLDETLTAEKFNDIILDRYSNIEKLYLWFKATDIDANNYEDEEALLYGDNEVIQEKRANIEQWQAEYANNEVFIAARKKDINEIDKKESTSTISADEKAQREGLEAQVKEYEDKNAQLLISITQAEEDIKAEKETATISDKAKEYALNPSVEINGKTYNYDTKEYRAAKFKAEFDQHLNLEYCLVYYIMTELLLCYDSRGKNMMIASWGPMENKGDDYIWFPIFYDIDTQLGINNTGIPTWDYDVDASMNAEVGAETFSTANSVLWCNLLYCFKDEIKAKYQEMREGKYLNQDFIEKAYKCSPEIFNTSYACKGVRPLVALNADIEYKYILPTLEVGSGTNYGYISTDGQWLQDSGNSFFYACQGDRDLSRQLLVRNRMNYLDSEMQAGNYSKEGATSGSASLKLRANANTTNISDKWLEVDESALTGAKSNFVSAPLGQNSLDAIPEYVITPFLSQYVSVYYDDTNVTSPIKYSIGDNPIEPEPPTSIVDGYKTAVPYTQQLNYIPGAAYLSKVDNLDLKYVDELMMTACIRLTELVLGNDDPEYFNKNSLTLTLDDSSTSPNAKTLLKKVVLTGLENLNSKTTGIDLTGSPKLEEFRALDTNISVCNIAIGAPISIMHLPSTVTELELNTNYNLTNLITETIEKTSAEGKEKFQEYCTTLKGLYIDGITNRIDREKTISELANQDAAKLSLKLSRISIKEDSLGYDSYQLVKFVLANRQNFPNQELQLRLENISWTPYTVLDTAAEFDASVEYYQLNDHYQYVKIENPTDNSDFQFARNNGLIYLKNNKDETQITSAELLEVLIADRKKESPQYKDTETLTNIPYLSGEIYINNSSETPITELQIQEYNKYYPSLDIRIANVTVNKTLKYVQLSENDVLKIYDSQKGAEWNSSNFENPNNITTLVPSKNNYDFKGWSTTSDGKNIIITSSSTDSDWETALAGFSGDVVTLYAIFIPHPYKATFYDYTQENILEVVTTDYTRDENTFINVTNILPSKPIDESLKLTEVYGFLGWALKNSPNKIVDLKTIKPIMDYEFIPLFEKKSVYDNVLDSKYLTFTDYDSEGSGYLVEVASGVTLSGKITLPATYAPSGKEKKPVKGIATAGFQNQNGITHIFFENSTLNSIQFIGQKAFYGCKNLVYFENTTLETINQYINQQAFSQTLLIENMSVSDQYQFFSRVKSIGKAAFEAQSNYNHTQTKIAIAGHVAILESQIFQGYSQITSISIGNEDDPSQLATIAAKGPFSGVGTEGTDLVLYFYYKEQIPSSVNALLTNINGEIDNITPIEVA